jgi:hypothetical protein
MSFYLEEAAALLRKAAETNEVDNRSDFRHQSLIAGRERIAMKFAQLAAIDRGVLPVEMAELILTQAREEASR